MPCMITGEMLTGHRENLIRRSRLRAESKFYCRQCLATQINLFPYEDRYTFSCERGEVALSRSFAAFASLLHCSATQTWVLRFRVAYSLFGDLDDDAFAIHLTACQMLDSFLGIRRVLELDEACTLRFTLSIEEQSGPFHRQILAAEEAIEGTLSGLVVQVAHVDR